MNFNTFKAEKLSVRNEINGQDIRDRALFQVFLKFTGGEENVRMYILYPTPKDFVSS